MARPAALVSVISDVREPCGLSDGSQRGGPSQQHRLPREPVRDVPPQPSARPCGVRTPGPFCGPSPVPGGAGGWEGVVCDTCPNLKAAPLSLCCPCSSGAGTT